MMPPAFRSGVATDLGLGIGLGLVGAVMAVMLPLVVSVGLVVGLLGTVVLMRFGRGAGGGAGMGGPTELAGSLLVATAFTIPMNRFAVPGTPVAVSDMLLVLTLGVYILTRLAEHRAPSRQGYAPILLGIGLLAVGGLIGAFFEVAGPFMYKALGVPIRDISGWKENIGNLINFLLGSLIPIGCWMLARPSRALLRRVMWGFVAGATVSALIGVLPYGRGGSRMIGMTVHPNQLGSLSMMGIGVALGLLLSERRLRVLPLLAFPILAYAILGSGSRAALGAVAILAVIIGPLTRSRAVMGALLTGVALVLLVFATGVVQPKGENAVGRALGDSDTAEGSDSIREDLQTRVWDVFSRRPLTGNGYNYMRPSHNVYLGLIASAGVLGVLGLGIVVTTVMRRAWRRRADLLAVAVAATYLAYLGNAYFDNIFWMRWLWFFVGMVAAAGMTPPGPGETGYRAPPARADVVPAGAGAAV
jgi:O-antigen ligase